MGQPMFSKHAVRFLLSTASVIALRVDRPRRIQLGLVIGNTG
jgi:hypothetical protein